MNHKQSKQSLTWLISSKTPIEPELFRDQLLQSPSWIGFGHALASIFISLIPEVELKPHHFPFAPSWLAGFKPQSQDNLPCIYPWVHLAYVTCNTNMISHTNQGICLHLKIAFQIIEQLISSTTSQKFLFFVYSLRIQQDHKDLPSRIANFFDAMLEAYLLQTSILNLPPLLANNFSANDRIGATFP